MQTTLHYEVGSVSNHSALVRQQEQRDSRAIHSRSCRRLERHRRWFNFVWTTYSDERLKKTFRVSRTTFNFIVQRIRHFLKRDGINEEPISPECRLAVCLYRLARGDYYYTKAEMTGLGVSTVCTIVNEVTKAIVENL